VTVQQAKNREFEGVVVIWPYQVGGDVEYKRCLPYNAIMRAKRWCNFIVQSQKFSLPRRLPERSTSMNEGPVVGTGGNGLTPSVGSPQTSVRSASSKASSKSTPKFPTVL
jgi:hypothetical protein